MARKKGLRAVVLSLDGALTVRMSATGPVGDAHGVGVRLAEQMLAEGAADLMTPSESTIHASTTVKRQHA